MATGSVERSVDPSILPPKWVRLLRSALLLVVGLVVTFSATFHERFAFDLALVALALAALGVVHLTEAWHRRGRGGVGVAAALGIASLAAAALLATFNSELAFAVVVAAWALVAALLEFVGMVTLPRSRQDAALVGAAGILLAITVLLARADMVAVVGFFGAYAVLTGVFLGIAALDSRAAAEPQTLGQNAAANA